MKRQITLTVLAAVLALGGVRTAQAQSGDAILDMLTKKGVITQKEANDVREQMDRNTAQAVDMYNKNKVSSWINSLTWYGDGRLRYEYRGGQANGATAAPVDNADRDRFRVRARFGFKGEASDNFSYGLRLEMSDSPRSSNVTMGGTAGAPFSKAGYALYVGQFWAQYKFNDYATFIGGKMENPFMTTSMVWDGDINPEGFAEKFTFTTEKVDYFLTLGQFMYKDSFENNIGLVAGFNDVWLFGIQAGGKVKFSDTMSATLAPTVYLYVNGREYVAAPGRYTNGTITSPVNNGAVSHLTVLDMPFEFAFPVGKLPFKVFGDFAMNLDGSQRAQDALGIATTYGEQKYAYQMGVSVGKNKKKGDWMAKAFWQHTEAFSLDPNLVDSDIFDSRMNMEGFAFVGQYCFTDFLSLQATYAHGSNIKSDLPTSYSFGADITSTTTAWNVRDYDLLQVDLNWKF